MKKWLGILALCGLSMGAVACGGSDGDGTNCLNENPKLVNEATKFDAFVKTDAYDADGNLNCLKYSENMATYLASDSQTYLDLKDAITTLPKFDTGNVLGSILCGAIDSIKVYSSAKLVKQHYEQAQACMDGMVDGTDESTIKAREDLSNSMAALDTVDGWNNVLIAAAQANQQQTAGN